MRLALKSVQTQAKLAGHEVSGTAGRYFCGGVRFNSLTEVTKHLNEILKVSVVPDLTVKEVQQLAQQMGMMVVNAGRKYQIFYKGQLLGESKRLGDVVVALPQYKVAIARYYEEEEAS